MADKFEALEQQLEMFIENTRQLGIIVSDFQPQGQNVLNQKLQTMTLGMQEIEKMKSLVQDVNVPLEVFDYIDQDSLKRFKALLLVELGKVFPKEIANYRALRGDDRPS
ncbi:hypothetical protein ScPMuIL_001793 [Solemya velum]